MTQTETFDVVVVGGGPAGATAAHDLARQGRSVLLLDRAGRVKPCGGAIPPRLIKDFEIPDHLLVARATSARMVSPQNKRVDIPIDNGFVGLVDREDFDEWLRVRAAEAGVVRRTGTFERLSRDDDGVSVVHFQARRPHERGEGSPASVRARAIIGADGARSGVARQAVPGAENTKYVFAYHEIVRAPKVLPMVTTVRAAMSSTRALCHGFLRWVFPHGDTLSIGTGSADKGFSLRQAVGRLRESAGLQHTETLRREGAPLPMKPLRRWDNGRDVVLAGMQPAWWRQLQAKESTTRWSAAVRGRGGQRVAALGQRFRVLKHARKKFMKAHGTVFLVLGVMQWFWYSNDRRRERFVKICEDRDVAATHLRVLHEQATHAQEDHGPRAHLLQRHGSPAWLARV